VLATVLAATLAVALVAAHPRLSGVPAALAAGGSRAPVEKDADRRATRDTWRSFARGFLMRYCVRCHNDDMAGDSWRDYRISRAVSAESILIGCGLAKTGSIRDLRGCPVSAPPARQFPLGDGPRPTDEERDRMLRWIDDGLP
jgi:hypothetical protein